MISQRATVFTNVRSSHREIGHALMQSTHVAPNVDHPRNRPHRLIALYRQPLVLDTYVETDDLTIVAVLVPLVEVVVSSDD